MAYGDPVADPYTSGGVPTNALSSRDLGRAAISGLTPMIQEITHEITGHTSLPPVTVATAGTRVRLNGTSLLVRRVILIPLPTNTNTIVVGDANVVAAMGTQATPTRRGIPLDLGGPIPWYAFEFNDLTNIWIDALTNGDGVTGIYYT